MLSRHFLMPLVGCIAAAALAACPSPASAQVVFTLTPATLVGYPGAALTFSARIENQFDTDIFINGLLDTGTAPELTVDSFSFFDYFDDPFPDFRIPAGSFYEGPLVDVTVDAFAATGTYTGTFDLLGGAGELDANPLASQDFSVTASAPEPSSLLLLAAGASLLARRRRG